ncbi:uncharacterized protein LOC131222739 [Magnolia sinica]|uniref:uncharacterized protein LOC131222739 n=1 Tax=Magnolia sinica TaxID=86752 RepID=UPI00265A7EB0|nr:uncharacterized protein LOC131222739 [Magnolia sinica]
MASSPFPYLLSHNYYSLMEQNHTILSLLFLAFSLSFLFFISFFKNHTKDPQKPTSNPFSIFRFSLSRPPKKPHQNQTHRLFLEILTSSHPTKWATIDPLIDAGIDESAGNCARADGSEMDFAGDGGGDDCERSGDLKGKKKKKRSKKKRQQNPQVEEEEGVEYQATMPRAAAEKSGVDFLYPFTSASSATQRKIKLHYDELVRSNDAKALTMAQVGQFANCLIEARNELQHKSEIIQRKFTITKALLFKADRSSFDRLCQQIYKLEAEQKRLEEDATVYNRLQEQLKLSPAYKKMLEISARMESQASSGDSLENPDAEYTDISFEELLAQEKKDSFWQRNGKLRTSAS